MRLTKRGYSINDWREDDSFINSWVTLQRVYIPFTVSSLCHRYRAISHFFYLFLSLSHTHSESQQHLNWCMLVPAASSLHRRKWLTALQIPLMHEAHIWMWQVLFISPSFPSCGKALSQRLERFVSLLSLYFCLATVSSHFSSLLSYPRFKSNSASCRAVLPDAAVTVSNKEVIVGLWNEMS